MASSSSVIVSTGLLAVVSFYACVATMSVSVDGATEDRKTSQAVSALARALQYYRPSTDDSEGLWSPSAAKREAALDVDYGWGGGRFGKRRMGDRLGIAGRFGRSVDRSAGSSREDADH